MTALTRDHVTALRKAVNVTFHTSTSATEQTAEVRAHMSNDLDDYVIIPVQFGGVDDYRRGRDVTGYECFSMVFASRYDAAWQTIARTIKPGSEVVLRWVAHNQSVTLDRAGFVQDHLDLTVHHAGRRYDFRVDTRVGLDDSARMVRPVRPVRA